MLRDVATDVKLRYILLIFWDTIFVHAVLIRV